MVLAVDHELPESLLVELIPSVATRMLFESYSYHEAHGALYRSKG